jgi:alcohol dehydrogenase class IV
MKHFHISTDIYFSDGALERLTQIEAKKAFIVTDPFMVSSGAISAITKPLEKGGTPYELFTDVVPDPPLEKVKTGVAEFASAGCDTIIGVGGGSAMDLSKAIRRIAQELDPGVHIPLICIPTTSGTGSEVTSFAVISDTERQLKIPLVSDSMTPDEAILDAVLVRSVPASVTADTGMDVLTHAIEAYVSTDHNDFSGALAEKAVEIVGQFLYRSWSNNEDAHARKKMHIAATLAGIAFNASSLGLNHGMAHAIGAHFHIAHGRANAMLLPLVIAYNSGVSGVTQNTELRDPVVERYCTIANVLGLSSVNQVMTVHSLCNYIRYLNEAMGIPSHLSEILTISREEYESHLDAMADAAIDDSCTATNPRVPLKPEVIDIYRKLW